MAHLLVSGGAGYIGSHVLRALQQKVEPEFWFQRIKVKPVGRSHGRNSSSYSLVEVEGYGKEIDRNVGVACEKMVANIKALPYVGNVKLSKGGQKRNRYEFTLEFDFVGKAEDQRDKAKGKDDDKGRKGK